MSIATELALLANTKENLRVSLGLSKDVPFSRYILSTPFTPRHLFISGEQGAWYDPSDLSTLFQDAAGITPVTDEGDPVGLMQDKSGNGNHATQSVSAARPIYRTDGGLHWLEFDGVDDVLVSAVIPYNSDQLSVYAAIRKTTNKRSPVMTGGGGDLSFGSPTQSSFSLLAQRSGSQTGAAFATRALEGALSSQYAVTDATNQYADLPPADLVVSGWANGSNMAYLRRNGEYIGSGSAPGTFYLGNQSLSIGRDRTDYYEGGFSGGLTINAQTADPLSVERYLATKVGITL